METITAMIPTIAALLRPAGAWASSTTTRPLIWSKQPCARTEVLAISKYSRTSLAPHDLSRRRGEYSRLVEDWSTSR